MRLWGAGVLLLLGTLPCAAIAAPVCVILVGNVVTAQVPCGESNNPPQTQIDTSDPRWTAWQLTQAQAAKQGQLDAMFNANFDLSGFVRNGTLTTVTGTQVANFLASITNNYRSLRAQIAAATTVGQVNAIDVSTGWPSNP